MAMVDTIRQYKEAVGRTIQRVESFDESGELGVTGTTIVISFTDGSEMRFCATARTELTAELSPARKKPHRVHADGAKSKAATA